MAKQVKIEAGRWDIYAFTRGIENRTAELLSEAIGERDSELLAMLYSELRTVREWIIGNIGTVTK